MTHLHSKLLTCAAILMLPSFATADLFSISLDVQGGASATESFQTIEDIVDLLEDTDGYDDINPDYTETSVATALLNFRGLEVIAEYPTAGPEVVFSIPALDFTQTFDDGTTRDDNGEAFADYIEDNVDGILQDIFSYLAAETPTDPVAGNPASLMTTMVVSDFAMGSPIGAIGTALQPGPGVAPGEDRDRRGGVGGLEARFANYSADGADVQAYTLPLSYGFAFQDSGRTLIVDLPVTFVDAEGTDSYSLSLGLGLGLPITPQWTLTPSARIGATGSVDLGAIGVISSVSLTSNYAFDFGSWAFDLGNGISYLSTIPIEVEDTEATYDLTNTVLRNGLGASRSLPFQILGDPVDVQLGVINSLFYGDELYIENSTEFTVAIASQRETNRWIFKKLSLGLSYIITDEDYSGYSLNFGYRF
ncbi:MAG: hypothetical protein AAGF71_07320 [Pseudomonadota bacterium]